jgi:hypothetical protein
MLAKQLWGLAALWVALYLSLSLVDPGTDKFEPGVAQALIYLHLVVGYCALSLIPGLKGNTWRERNLVRRGFEMVRTVQAETPEAAISQVAGEP